MKRRPRRNPSPKNTDIFIDIGGTFSHRDYLNKQHDGDGREYMSASKLKAIASMELFNKDSEALSFGRIFHEICEKILTARPYIICKNAEYKKLFAQYEEDFADQPGKMPVIYKMTPADFNKMNGMITQFITYCVPAVDGKKLKTELSVLISSKFIKKAKTKIIPTELMPFHAFLVNNDLSVKARFDAVHHDNQRIIDWKSTTCTSISTMLYDARKFGYFLQACVYKYVSLLAFGKVYSLDFMFFPKVEELGIPVQATYDMVPAEIRADHLTRSLPGPDAMAMRKNIQQSRSDTRPIGVSLTV